MRTDEIVKLFSEYMGFTPSSDQISKFGLMDRAEVEDILKNTKSDVSSEATKGVNQAIESLKTSLGQAGTSYMSQLASFQQQAGQAYGLPEAEEQLQKSQKWASEIATKGPMFEQTMAGGLQGASPTFLGATRKSLDEYFANIPNPLVRDKMVKSYLDAADDSMKANLNALNGLYKTSLLAAQSAFDIDKTNYTKIAGKVQDLYSDFQWLSRDRWQEQQQEPKKVQAKYETRLNQEISNVYGGRYGKQGSREQAISVLQGEYPDMDVSKDIFRRIPDGYEKSVTQAGGSIDQWEYDAAIWQWLSSEGSGLTDEEKAQQIKSLGRNPESFGIYGY